MRLLTGGYLFPKLISTLREIRIGKFSKYYTEAFTMTPLTEVLQELAHTRFDCNLITDAKIKKF